tara:strand:- start:1489 stop:1665 length:177 start_codon:yes stop_codon:yes gene_type:complete
VLDAILLNPSADLMLKGGRDGTGTGVGVGVGVGVCAINIWLETPLEYKAHNNNNADNI